MKLWVHKLTLFLPAGRLLPAGRGRLGAAGPDGFQGDRGSQPTPLHGCLRHPGHGLHALPAGLPGLLWCHQGEQVSAALCESNHRGGFSLFQRKNKQPSDDEVVISCLTQAAQ